ncbi:PDZ domain-containing protein [Candidatus Poribacteria bacterium]|nr:PDZ domain-containing protein [Candidatus Poribacteria bacterium]
MSEGRKTYYAIIILQAVILVFAVLIGHSLGKSQIRESLGIRPDMVDEVMLYIKEKYKDENVDTEKLVYGSVKGMVAALDDPYSQFMNPETYAETMEDTSGKFGGLGIEISLTNMNGYERLTVMSVLGDDTPAYKAGVETGDYIIAIEGESTMGISLEKAKQKLRGEPGTKVEITVLREGEDNPVDIVVTRGIIQAPTVEYRILENDVGYLRIKQFSDTTPKDVDKALDDFEDAKIKGIVLDLRSNPGGTLSAAVEVSSDFLKQGQLVVYTKHRNEEDNREFRVKKDSPHPWHPLVVLVDHWSASGSEIVVGAIKDHKRGLIIGGEKPTFGKGSVQTIFPLSDGKSGLKLTVADYYTPNGININKVGIIPDVKYPGLTLTSSEARIYRKLRISDSLENFINEAGDDVLYRLEESNSNGDDEEDDSTQKMFESFVKKLGEEDIILSESLIKLAIAQKTENEDDEYEYDPVIRFAINHLRAFDVLGLARN